MGEIEVESSRAKRVDEVWLKKRETPLLPKLTKSCLTLITVRFYRLPTLSKVFERLVLNQLIIYINEEALLVLQYRDSERVIENLLFYWGSVTF